MKNNKVLKETDALILLYGLKKIITIFLTTFLTTYIVRSSTNYMIDVSYYSIFSFIFLGFFTFLIGYFIKSKISPNIFRIGIILFSILILTIILLKENIIKYLPLLGFLYGISGTTYHYPYNIYLSQKVDNNERISFEVKKETLSSVISVIVPTLLGYVITYASFRYTALIILLVCILQLILSFYITPLNINDKFFTPLNSFKKMWSKKETKNILILDMFRGMNISDGALTILSTILIFNAFKTDLNVGIISSISSLLVILLHYWYKKNYKEKDDSKLIIISSLIPVITIIILLFIKTNFTYILYYLGYNVLTNLLTLIVNVRLYNISSSKISKKDLMEFWSIRELFLNFGRLISYTLLIVIYKLNPNFLYELLVLLSISILIMGFILLNIKKEKAL